MLIDIITFTDEQYALLTEEQLLEIKNAQLKKDRVLAKLKADLHKEKQRLVSSIWRMLQEEYEVNYERELDNIREPLLFYLRFSIKAEGSDQSPYKVDYSLAMDERFHVVKNYYEATYSDKKKRFDAFKLDEVAVVYLGEFYAPLYDFFLETSRQ